MLLLGIVLMLFFESLSEYVFICSTLLFFKPLEINSWEKVISDG